MDVGFSPGDFVLDGDPVPLPKKGAPPPQFSVHVYCGQTAGWIKMALGMEIGLGPVHNGLDGDTAPIPKKGAEPPIFGQVSAYATFCSMWTQLPPEKRHTHPTQFLVMSIVAKWLDG